MHAKLENQTLDKISSPYDIMTIKANADPQKTKQVSKDLLLIVTIGLACYGK